MPQPPVTHRHRPHGLLAQRPSCSAQPWLPGLLLLAALLPAAPGAADDSRIELTDGSVLVGEITGMRDGWYRVESPALGSLDIETSRIRSIRYADDGGGTAAPADAAPIWSSPGGIDGALTGQVESLQRQMVGNPDIMRQIMGLQQDPALQRAIADPELMGLIAAGDLDGLRAHPAFQALMGHPGIRALIDQLQPR